MKIMVRILASAKSKIHEETDLVMLEDKFIKHVTDKIQEELTYNSPRDYRMPYAGSHAHTSRQVLSVLARNKEISPRLWESWVIRKGALGSMRVTNTAPHAKFLAAGTGIYGKRGSPIRPKNKKAMFFYYSFIRKWVVAKQVRGINPARFKKMMDESQLRGTEIGVRKAMKELETTWRGRLQAKLIRL